MEELITVVIPIYNVSRYLERCVQSIVNQTYENLEIILVDDGSTDGSSEICDKLQENDSRIIVIHKKNGGLSDARNAGINIAQGKYIYFIDSDDYANMQSIEVLYKGLVQHDADMTFGGFVRFSDYEPIDELTVDDEIDTYVCGRDEAFGNLYGTRGAQSTVAWGKLYKLTLFENIRYPFGMLSEDEGTTYKLINKAKKIVYVDNPLYYYYQREDSIMGKESPKRCSDYMILLNERHMFIKEYLNQYTAIDGVYCLEMFCVVLQKYMRINNFTMDSKLKQIYCEYYHNYHKKVNKVKKVKRVKIWLMRYFPVPFTVLCMMKNVLRKKS